MSFLLLNRLQSPSNSEINNVENSLRTDLLTSPLTLVASISDWGDKQCCSLLSTVYGQYLQIFQTYGEKLQLDNLTSLFNMMFTLVKDLPNEYISTVLDIVEPTVATARPLNEKEYIITLTRIIFFPNNSTIYALDFEKSFCANVVGRIGNILATIREPLKTLQPDHEEYAPHHFYIGALERLEYLLKCTLRCYK